MAFNEEIPKEMIDRNSAVVSLRGEREKAEYLTEVACRAITERDISPKLVFVALVTLAFSYAYHSALMDRDALLNVADDLSDKVYNGDA